MRGDGRWYQRGNQWWIEYWFRGKQHRESAGGDEAAAKRKLKDRLKEIHGDRFIGPSAERVTVGQLLDAYEAHLRTKGAKALESVASQLKPVREFFTLVRAVEVTTSRVRKFIDDRLEAGRAPATVNRSIQALRAAFRLAIKEERLVRVPYFPTLREENTRRGFFEREQFEAVVAELPDPVNDVARFAYLTGWRRGEITGLRWEDVDRATGVVYLWTSKNGERRTVPMSVELKELVESRWEKRRYKVGKHETALSEYVFHIRGQAIKDFKHSWASACKRARQPGLLFHDLRRTAVRDMIRGGVQQAVAMAITGHKTDAIFRRYNITDEEDKREALRRLAAYRASKPAAPKVVEITIQKVSH